MPNLMIWYIWVKHPGVTRFGGFGRLRKAFGALSSCFLQMMLPCWDLQAESSRNHGSCLQLGWESAPWKLRPSSSNRRGELSTPGWVWIAASHGRVQVSVSCSWVGVQQCGRLKGVDEDIKVQQQCVSCLKRPVGTLLLSYISDSEVYPLFKKQ